MKKWRPLDVGHGAHGVLAREIEVAWAANLRIAQLTRERDELRRTNLSSETGEIIAKSVRAQAIQDTKDAAVKALGTHGLGNNPSFNRGVAYARIVLEGLEVK